MSSDSNAPAQAQTGAPAPVELTEVPGILGEAMAPLGSTLQAMVRDLRQTKVFRSAHFRALERVAAEVHRLSLMSQQISRMETGRLRQSHERLALDAIVNEALRQNEARFAAASVHVESTLKSELEVIVDPGLLVSLVDAALASQMPNGNSMSVRLHLRNWPEHAVLTVIARPGVEEGGARKPIEPRNSPDWVLLLQLARAMGVTVHREVVGREVLLSLEFPRTVKKLEGMSALELDVGNGTGFGATGFGGTAFGGVTESRPLAGHRLLLIADDRSLRDEVAFIARDMGLNMEFAPDMARAVRMVELERPDLIVIEGALRDAEFEELRADLQRHDINFPCIEIAANAHGVEMGSWMGDSISRVGRSVLREQLPSLLVMEMAKVV